MRPLRPRDLDGRHHEPAGAPAIQCAPVADQGDRCTLIANQGHCSPNVTGLCICDNGIR